MVINTVNEKCQAMNLDWSAYGLSGWWAMKLTHSCFIVFEGNELKMIHTEAEIH